MEIGPVAQDSIRTHPALPTLAGELRWQMGGPAV